MKINSVNSISLISEKNSRTKAINKNTCKIKEHAFVPISNENIKANFCPSFGQYKKAGTVELYDKETGEFVKATVKRNKDWNFIDYKLYKDREELGYITINLEPDFADNDSENFKTTFKDIPQVEYLRSIHGDKYRGIGTELINLAIKESEKKGKKGALFLIGEKGYASERSKYRRNENPIPFYYKLGFRAYDEDIHRLIEESLTELNYNNLPTGEILYLPAKEN